jgi:phenylacetate-CoA ligase
VLERTGNLDSLTVVVERREDASGQGAMDAGVALQKLVKNSIGVSVDVHVVEPEGIERSMGKMKRIIDHRP